VPLDDSKTPAVPADVIYSVTNANRMVPQAVPLRKNQAFSSKAISTRSIEPDQDGCIQTPRRRLNLLALTLNLVASAI
jgi:antitoxin (DNA-binding transcriptional repressor) of toxin-antitoxin stability system